MKLRTKTLLLFAGTTICLIVILHSISENIILSNSLQLEQTEVGNSIGQVQIALNNELTQFQSSAYSWVNKNDIASFVKKHNSTLPLSSQEVESLVDLGANYILIYDVQGKFDSGIGFNLTTYQKESIPDNLITEIEENEKIWNLQELDSGITGFLLLSNKPAIIASSPLLAVGVDDGSMQGELVLVRYFDSATVAALSRSVRLPVTLELYDAWQGSAVEQTRSSLSPTTFSQAIDTNYIIGYSVVNDLNTQPAFVLGVTIPRNVYVQGIITVNYVDMLVLASCVVFSVAVVLMLEFFMLSKLSKLNEAVSKLSHRQNLSERLPTTGNDEITTLTKSINNMLSEIEDNTHKLQKAERFSAIGELSSMVAHDLRNPLQGIANAAFFLKRKANPLTTEKEKEMIRLIENNVKYSDKIVRDLLDYSRQIKLDLQPVTPKCLLVETCSLVSVPQNIHVVDKTLDSPVVLVDVDKIKRVFANMVTNACDAMPKGGTLTVSCESVGEEALFIFSDTGAGMSEETQRKLFQPLFTTKAKGMGFGLSICKRIVDAHGGRIMVKSALGEGTSFNIYLPAVSKLEGR
ncbi:MAG: ATP-binding protein [Candidatus Bathyarchaeota archaeon]|nr:ATP-binding protein [Candidatus Bathyarchaeota archaeon]